MGCTGRPTDSVPVTDAEAVGTGTGAADEVDSTAVGGGFGADEDPASPDVHEESPSSRTHNAADARRTRTRVEGERRTRRAYVRPA